MNACTACAQREDSTSVRDHGMGGVDITLGLQDQGGGIFVCPECGQRYERTEDRSEAPFLFQDYDMYYFRKREPVLSRAQSQPGCASCGGVDAPKAWASLHHQHVASLVREVHFGIDVLRCACGQPWVEVFTERVGELEADLRRWLGEAFSAKDASAELKATADEAGERMAGMELPRPRPHAWSQDVISTQ